MATEKIINLTPHSVTVNGIEIPSSGVARLQERFSGCLKTPVFMSSSGVARLQERNEPAGEIMGIPMIRQVRGDAEGLPPQQEGVWIIVSRPIFDALPDRRDLLAIGETIRDAQGKILGAKNLVMR